MALTIACLVAGNCAYSLDIADPRVEFRSNPMDIVTATPRFSWRLVSEEPATTQADYRITVKDSNERMVWDSGKIKSDKTYGIYYSGEKLDSEESYLWEVEVTDNHGKYSKTASFFETTPEDWKGAQWIGGSSESAPFHPQYFPVFSITFDMRFEKGCKEASLIYGANDWRLLDHRKNPYGIKADKDTSYIKIQFSSDSISIYRHYYSPSDILNPRIASFKMPEGTDVSDSHSIRINSVSGKTDIIVDSLVCGTVNLNPVGNGGDYISYPVVGDVGFESPEGSAHITNFHIESFRSPHNILATLEPITVKGRVMINVPETGALRLRKQFRISKPVRRARLYATSRGIYDFYLNGKRVSDKYFNPGLTQYNRHHPYQTYDITGMLSEGDNVAGIQLNEGWWSGAVSFEPSNWNWFGNRQSLLCRIKIDYEDGTSDNIVSDTEGWKYSTHGPVRYGSLFQGEIYDARKGGLEWTSPCYDDTGWCQALEVELDGVVTDGMIGGWPLADDYSDHSLIPSNDSGVGCYETLTSKTMTEPSVGQYVYDMGQNCAGVPEITFRDLKEGQVISIRFAEVLYPENDIYGDLKGFPMVENLRGAMSQDIYISSGQPVETFSPRSTYHGYRYIEITGIDNPIALDDVKSKVLSSIESFTSGFHSSDPLLDQLVANTKYSALSNIFSIPTDCPQRNERMGWSGDVSVFAPAMTFLFDCHEFLSRHTLALRDTRDSDGAYPPIAPLGGGFGGPLWQSAGIVLPWQLYLKYGDTEIIKENYPAMKEYILMVLDRYIDKNDGHFKGTETWVDLGDWLGPQCNQNDKTLIFDSYLIYELQLMSKMAEALGFHEDSLFFQAERDKRKSFVSGSYLDTGKGVLVGRGFGPRTRTWTGPVGGLPAGFENTGHTSYAVPLALGVFDGEERRIVADRLKYLVGKPSKGDDGNEYPPYSLMTGFVGTPWILHALADNNYIYDAYSILQTKSYPSWFYPLTLGATSVWERLNSMTEEEGFGQNNSMNSFNHYAFGCVYDWLIQCCAGIKADPEEPGFKHFILNPHPDTTGWLKNASAYYCSPYGKIESSWKIGDEGYVTYEFTVPPNASATLILQDESIELKSGCHTFKRHVESLSR